MPEIWLNYGSTDVVLDLRFENLVNHISSNFKLMPEDEFRQALADAPLKESTLIIALSSSKAVARTIAILMELAHVKGLANVTIDALPGIASVLRSNFPDSRSITVNRADYQSLSDRINKFQSVILISQISFDPLFGFAGVPTSLIRRFSPEKMNEAFAERRDNRPAPGIEAGPLNVAISSTENISATSIEIVGNSFGIAGVHFGSVEDAFHKAITQMASIACSEVEPVKSAIISASSEVGPHSTLSDSLNSLWNSIGIVQDGGSAILLAENRDGIGGGAMQLWIEERLKPEQLKQVSYIDGLEHLLYFEELRRTHGLGIVSTIPQYYSKVRLGFNTFLSVKDAMQSLMAKYGKNHKVLVLSDADIMLLKPKLA